MSTKKLRKQVLGVIAGQSPDYFIFPNASAFVAEGLDPVKVAEALDDLHADGTLVREVFVHMPDANANGEPEQVPGGYRLKTEEEAMSETEGTPVVDPPEPDAEPGPGTEEQGADEDAGEGEGEDDD